MKLRLGSRGSLLALTQSRTVAASIESACGMEVGIDVITTSGDLRIDLPLSELGGKGLFTAELDRALVDGSIDLAVHSLKDLPTELDPALTIAAIPEREDARDVLIGPEHREVSLSTLAPGARVGTSSLRRTALARAFRPDLDIRNIRGNLDTRLRKMDEGLFDAVILAAAGVRRLGWSARISEMLDAAFWLPAPGQGALALVVRSDNHALRTTLGILTHAPTSASVRAERALLNHLEGGCQVPIGALGKPFDGGLRLWGIVASPDGRRVVRGDLTGSLDHPERLGTEVAELLLARGADIVLDRVRRDLAPPLSPP